MKRNRLFCILISVLLVTLSLAAALVPASAVTPKSSGKRSIAIVFDNSGSMYYEGELAWSRATYAMEVFAAMLNDGDKLSIYPMWDIKADGRTFNMHNPLFISGPNQAPVIRGIDTPMAGSTPIETIQCAHDGLQNESGEKWLIILTDGDTFYENDKPLKDTDQKLKQKLEDSSQDMNVLYLGIGPSAAKPDCRSQGDYVVQIEKVSDSKQVLSKLTSMCNIIFGRDTLPASHFTNNVMDIDVSLKKLIVFAQGENITDVKVKNQNGEELKSVSNGEYATHYPVNGCSDSRYESTCKSDTSLQGVIMTYGACSSSKYTISYSGQATSVEAYYEPDVDMDFKFTDQNGNTVSPSDLYEGDYVISFGMKDAKTGQFTESDLLGDVDYDGGYTINGNRTPIQLNGKKGSVNVSLKTGDKFNADMWVTYLGGYKIYKTSLDFGWPEGGLTVQLHPAGDLEVRISGGQEVYPLSKLEEGEPFRAEIWYQGKKLTGEELRKAALSVDAGESAADVQTAFKDDYYEIRLRHKDSSHPEATAPGAYRIPVSATYTPPASEQSTSPGAEISYTIEDDGSSLEVKMSAEQVYYVIYEIEEGQPLRADVTKDGQPLTDEEFRLLTAEVDAGGIPYEIEPRPNESAYLIWLKGGESATVGMHKVSLKVKGQDQVGRTIESDDYKIVSYSTLPKWLTTLIVIGSILLLALLLFLILRIKALPRKVRESDAGNQLVIGGKDLSADTDFTARLEGGSLTVRATTGTQEVGLSMSVTAGTGSRVSTPNRNRSAKVVPGTIALNGDITNANIANTMFRLKDDTLKANPEGADEDLEITDGDTIAFSGTVMENGTNRKFHAKIIVEYP